MSDKDILENIKNNDDRWIRFFYDDWKAGFLSWLGSKFGIDSNSAAEIFQSSMVTFYENIVSGKVVELKSSLKTYFFAIGKNKGFDFLKAKKKMSGLTMDQFTIYHGMDSEDNYDELEASLQMVQNLLSEIGEPCYPLLKLFYFNKMNWESIAKALGYKNVNSAKNMKYKCVLKMRKIVQGRYPDLNN